MAAARTVRGENVVSGPSRDAWSVCRSYYDAIKRDLGALRGPLMAKNHCLAARKGLSPRFAGIEGKAPGSNKSRQTDRVQHKSRIVAYARTATTAVCPVTAVRPLGPLPAYRA